MYASTAYSVLSTYPISASRPYGSSGSSIVLVQDRDEWGERAYYFLRLPFLKHARFLREVEADRPLDLSEYGEILYSAYGAEPSDAARSFMRQRYGWNG